jgi:hypothetical protein
MFGGAKRWFAAPDMTSPRVHPSSPARKHQQFEKSGKKEHPNDGNTQFGRIVRKGAKMPWKIICFVVPVFAGLAIFNPAGPARAATVTVDGSFVFSATVVNSTAI